MIRPTNGRIVLFTPSRDDNSDLVQHGVLPLSAIVAHVWGDRLVNLTVFDSDGVSWPRKCVQLLQDDDAKPEGGYFCSWMEYQKGQAAKTEAAETALATKA